MADTAVLSSSFRHHNADKLTAAGVPQLPLRQVWAHRYHMLFRQLWIGNAAAFILVKCLQYMTLHWVWYPVATTSANVRSLTTLGISVCATALGWITFAYFSETAGILLMIPLIACIGLILSLFTIGIVNNNMDFGFVTMLSNWNFFVVCKASQRETNMPEHMLRRAELANSTGYDTYILALESDPFLVAVNRRWARLPFALRPKRYIGAWETDTDMDLK